MSIAQKIKKMELKSKSEMGVSLQSQSDGAYRSRQQTNSWLQTSRFEDGKLIQHESLIL